ncbi:hypothetical protein [Thermococcus peptonophilus]|uniref:Uncharacterized protein n=1 Tax=Thermococcus peptonophilus TaxID=53952 RepID=A0A142CVP0_9EURY|nr:hypothetical protein [Thermococcus peptonophilus]AMQ18842.1 hypothetical protein A0127_06470 [Thermococcus peptonophilus]
MIGFIASLLAAVALKESLPVLAVVPYLLRFKGKSLGILGFSVYALALLTLPESGSFYHWEGAKESLLLGFSLLLVLDDILRGSLKPEREELILSAVLAVSALTDYTLVIALPAVFIYRAYRGFGRGALYFGAWFGASLTLVYALKSRLPGPGAEASIIAAVSLAFLFIAERKEVGLNEVGVLEEK